MDKAKKRRLQAGGWKIATAADFLGLSREEINLVEMKLAFARGLRQRRVSRKWTQAQLAERLGTSQSRVTKMEAADPSVSFDLLIRSLLTIGATRRDLGRLIGKRANGRAA